MGGLEPRIGRRRPFRRGARSGGLDAGQRPLDPAYGVKCPFRPHAGTIA